MKLICVILSLKASFCLNDCVNFFGNPDTEDIFSIKEDGTSPDPESYFLVPKSDVTGRFYLEDHYLKYEFKF